MSRPSWPRLGGTPGTSAAMGPGSAMPKGEARLPAPSKVLKVLKVLNFSGSRVEHHLHVQCLPLPRRQRTPPPGMDRWRRSVPWREGPDGSAGKCSVTRTVRASAGYGWVREAGDRPSRGGPQRRLRHYCTDRARLAQRPPVARLRANPNARIALPTVANAARRIGAHEQTVRGWIETGERKAAQLGARTSYRINRTDDGTFPRRRTLTGAIAAQLLRGASATADS